MSNDWQLIQDAMALARESRRTGSDAEPVLATVEALRGRPDGVPAREALLDLVAAAARGPVTVAQLGQTLDGKIATNNGHSRYVNGASALDHLHRLRALVDAVVIGVGTLLDDDPALTVRRCTGDNPVRVVVTSRADLPGDRKLFTDAAAPTLVTGRDLAVQPGPDGDIDPAEILQVLHAAGLNVILVEGGARTVSRFLSAGSLDRLHLLVAPTVLGSGRCAFSLEAAATIDQAVRFSPTVYQIDSDFLFDLERPV